MKIIMIKTLPYGYKAAKVITVKDVLWGWLVVLGGAIFIVGMVLFIMSTLALRELLLPLPPICVLAFALQSIAALMLHEGIHGLCIKVLGAKPRFGFVILQRSPIWGFYTTAPGYFFTRYEFIVIALAPLFILTLAGLALIGAQPVLLPWIGPLLVFNASGSVGDIWISLQTLKQPKRVLVENCSNIVFYMPDD